MPASLTLEAIVLQTHDVGEADRFCILLTKERGKIAARARGVRKMKSRMGGSLLPFQHVHILVHESGEHFLITSAHVQRDHISRMHLDAFLKAQYVAEILLRTLEDDHPMPETFALTAAFLDSCSQEHIATLPFLLRYLMQLGVLPKEVSNHLYMHCSLEERAVIAQCTEWQKYPQVDDRTMKGLRTLCEHIVDGHMSGKRVVQLA